MVCRSTMVRRNACLTTASLVLFGAGFFFLFLWQKILDMIMDTQFVLAQDNQLYNTWKKTPVPVFLDLYLWNWTNPTDIYNHTVKVKLQQVGPYRYKEVKEKVNITWNDNNSTVTFRHRKSFYFDEEGSAGKLDDLITSINPTAVSAVRRAKTWGFVAKQGFSIALRSIAPEIHVTKTAGQILFDGYQDSFLDLAQTFPGLAGSSMPPFKKFAWFYGRNGSETFEGIFNMETGKGNTLGTLKTWNYWTNTPYFPGTCGIVEGSAGELFPAKREKDYIRFFSTDLCRNVKLDYLEDIDVYGIKAYKYAGGDSMLDNGTLVPENYCYCNGECVPFGLMNVSSCRYGSPAFVSLPHFYKADPSVYEKLDGMDARKDAHEFFIALEPTTGLPVKVSARLQLNLLVEPVPYIASYHSLPKVFFPILWFEQSVQVPEDMVFPVKVLLYLPLICLCTGIVLLALGMVSSVILLRRHAFILLNQEDPKCKKVKSKEEQPLQAFKS